jgi:hypothetical protein
MLSSMPFTYSPTALDGLDSLLTTPRLSRYLAVCNGDRQRAIQLYEYNTRVSEAMYGLIQPLEIAFRNSIHQVLTHDLKRPDWYDMGILQTPELESISAARSSLWRWKKAESPDRIIAELMFGFWVKLLNKNYEKSLWVTHLHKCFPYGPKPDREKTHERFIKIRDLRNRIAHHEPIFFKNLETEYTRVLTSIEWICPVTACWVRSTHSISRLNKM